jgi:hypothetical protein
MFCLFCGYGRVGAGRNVGDLIRMCQSSPITLVEERIAVLLPRVYIVGDLNWFWLFSLRHLVLLLLKTFKLFGFPICLVKVVSGSSLCKLFPGQLRMRMKLKPYSFKHIAILSSTRVMGELWHILITILKQPSPDRLESQIIWKSLRAIKPNVLKRIAKIS